MLQVFTVPIPGGGVTTEFRDEWLSSTLEELVGTEKLTEIRESGDAQESLWETAVAAGVTVE